MTRLTFLSHFVICLAVSAAAWFAWRASVFSVVWTGDASHMTSVIAALFVGTAAWLGWQSWRADSPKAYKRLGWTDAGAPLMVGHDLDAAWGHVAERILPACGLFGTVYGLSLELHAKGSGADVLSLLGTALYCTAAGVLTMALVMLMVFSLERGISRARG